MPATAHNAPATNIILSYSPGDVNVHCIQHGLPTWVCSSKTASRSVYPFLQGSWLCPTPKYPTLYNVYKWIRHPSKYALPPWRDIDPIYVVPWAHIPHEPTSQTDSLAVWPFLQGSQWCPNTQTSTQTDHATPSVATSTLCMPKNYKRHLLWACSAQQTRRPAALCPADVLFVHSLSVTSSMHRAPAAALRSCLRAPSSHFCYTPVSHCINSSHSRFSQIYVGHTLLLWLRYTCTTVQC